jgi:hypothetical protein
MQNPWSAIIPMLLGVLRLSVALLVCVAQHERGARHSTVAAIARQLVVSFREERTYGGFHVPDPKELDAFRSALPTPTHVRLDERISQTLTGCSAVG